MLFRFLPIFFVQSVLQKCTVEFSFYDIVEKRILRYMTKFPKLRTLTGDEKSKKFFGEPTFTTPFYRSALTLKTISNTSTRKNVNVFFLPYAIFHFLPFFVQFLNSTQSEFGCYKRETNAVHTSHNGILGFLHTHSTHSDIQVRSEHD